MPNWCQNQLTVTGFSIEKVDPPNKPASHAPETAFARTAGYQPPPALFLFERLTAKGFKVSVLLHWGGDAAVLEKRWPGITLFRGNGVGLDIDHPGSRELVREVGEGIFPALGNMAWYWHRRPFDRRGWIIAAGRRSHQRRSRGWARDRHPPARRASRPLGTSRILGIDSINRKTICHF